MPISRHVDAEDWTVYVTVRGTISPAEVTACVDAVRRDPNISPNMRWLVDARNATVVFFGDEIQTLAFEHSGSRVDLALRLAVVVSTDVAVGLARMFADFGGFPADTFAVFRDVGEAREWLGLSAKPTETPRVPISSA